MISQLFILACMLKPFCRFACLIPDHVETLCIFCCDQVLEYPLLTFCLLLLLLL